LSLIVVAVGYLLGSIPFAFFLARRLGGIDLRVAGSGNLGAANVMRTTRPWIGVLVLLLDVGKGAAAVGTARFAGAGEAVTASAAVAAVIGHVYPIWLGLRGGKGVAAACGAFAALAPIATAIATAIFIVTLWSTRYVSLGSILAGVSLTPLVHVTGASREATLASGVAAALIVLRHRENLVRLARRTERRLGERR
jgi:glycerol-3-phosphate acyltransferase PlsY